MNYRSIFTRQKVSAAVIGCLLCVAGGLLSNRMVLAQGPVGNTINVKLDRTAMVGEQILQTGDYTIRQITSASNPSVLEFSTDRGSKVEATVTAIPVLQNTPPNETKIVFNNEAGMPRIRRIMVQGREYGYEFPLSAAAAPVRSAVNMQLQYQAPTTNASASPSTGATSTNSVATDSSSNTTVATAPTTPSTNSGVVANNSVSAQSDSDPARRAADQNRSDSATNRSAISSSTATANDSTTNSNTSADSSRDTTRTTLNAGNQTAGNQSAANGQSSTAPSPSTGNQLLAQNAPSTPTTQSTNAGQSSSNSSNGGAALPATALGWMDLLLAGSVCLAAGALIYRRTA